MFKSGYEIIDLRGLILYDANIESVNKFLFNEKGIYKRIVKAKNIKQILVTNINITDDYLKTNHKDYSTNLISVYGYAFYDYGSEIKLNITMNLPSTTDGGGTINSGNRVLNLTIYKNDDVWQGVKS